MSASGKKKRKRFLEPPAPALPTAMVTRGRRGSLLPEYTEEEKQHMYKLRELREKQIFGPCQNPEHAGLPLPTGSFRPMEEAPYAGLHFFPSDEDLEMAFQACEATEREKQVHWEVMRREGYHLRHVVYGCRHMMLVSLKSVVEGCVLYLRGNHPSLRGA